MLPGTDGTLWAVCLEDTGRYVVLGVGGETVVLSKEAFNRAVAFAGPSPSEHLPSPFVVTARSSDAGGV